MAKSKWIVPAVAMMLCAVSLIGAGYAAYSATLTDNETITADNNYVTLTLGTTTFADKEIDLEYVYTAEYTNGGSLSQTWAPYLANNKVLLGGFSVAGDVTNEDTTRATTSYNLTLTGLTCEQTLTGAALKVYSEEAMTTEITTLTALEYGTTYYLAFAYTHADADNLTSAPAAEFDITYTLTATANGMSA